MNSDNNEVLFWKVIHNRYLFVKILHTIEKVEWVKYKNIKSFDDSYRIKFKYIYSLEWMVKHGQYQLLKCKLLNDQEYVEFETHGIALLLSTHYNTDPKDLEFYKELLQLVIKRLKLNLSSIQIAETLFSISFKCYTNVMNLIFEYLNDGTTLESTIRNLYKEKNKREQFNLYFESAISHRNHELINMIIEIILKEEQQKQDTGDGSGCENSNEMIKPSCWIAHFLGIGNTNIQNRLLDLKLLGISAYNEEFTSKFTNYVAQLLKINCNGDIIESLIICFKIFARRNKQEQQQLIQQLYEYQQQGLDNSLVVKELFKQFIILSKSTELFKLYLSKYNQVIMELVSIDSFHLVALEYSFENFIPDLDLKSYSKLNKQYKRKDKPFVSANLSRSIEFLKLYLSKLSSQPQQVSNEIMEITINIIYDIVFEITDPIQYEQFVNNEIPECYKKLLPLKWNPIINQLNYRNVYTIIKDTETIDWMVHWFIKRLERDTPINCKRFYKSFDQYIFKLLSFKSLGLATYACNQLLFLELEESNFYVFHFLEAIIKSDFQTIKFIHSLGIEFTEYDIVVGEFNDVLQIVIMENGDGVVVNYQEFNQIIEYIIEHPMISDYSIYNGLFKFVVDHGYYNDSKYNKNGKSLIQYDLNQIKFNSMIDTNGKLRQVLSDLYYAIEDYNHFRFLLANINNNLLFPEGKTTDRIKFSSNGNTHDKTSLIISLIHLLVEQLNQCRETIYLSNGCQFYNAFLNSLFNSLILYNEEFEMLKQIKQVYQMLLENQVELVFSNHVKIEYIKCVSPTIYRYLYYLLDINDGQRLLLHVKFSNEILCQFKLFSLEDSFDQQLELLLYRPYVNTFSLKDGAHYIPHNLSFYLYIKRIDLFKLEWELIKTINGPSVVLSTSTIFSNKFKMISLICINLELDLIFDILDTINNNIETYKHYTNTSNIELLYEFFKVSLKLGILEICNYLISHLSKLSKQYQISKYFAFSQLIDQIVCDSDYILSNRFSLINILNTPDFPKFYDPNQLF